MAGVGQPDVHAPQRPVRLRTLRPRDRRAVLRARPAGRRAAVLLPDEGRAAAVRHADQGPVRPAGLQARAQPRARPVLPGLHLRSRRGNAVQGRVQARAGRFPALRDKGGLELGRYWELSFEPDESKTLEEWADEISDVMDASLRDICDEDETPDSFLSGGVDSSYILAKSRAKCGFCVRTRTRRRAKRRTRAQRRITSVASSRASRYRPRISSATSTSSCWPTSSRRATWPAWRCTPLASRWRRSRRCASRAKAPTSFSPATACTERGKGCA